MCSDNIVTHSQPQTGATFLGAEERLKDIFRCVPREFRDRYPEE